MSTRPKRIKEFQETLAEVSRAASEMRDALKHSNDETHQVVFCPVLDRLDRILSAERNGLTQYIADELINVRNGIRRLRLPDIDPDLDAPTQSLKVLRSARGNFVESLDNAMEAAAALNMLPHDSGLGQIRLEREAFGDALVRLDERLRVVEENLDDLNKASQMTDSPSASQSQIMGVYVQKIGIEVNAARFETGLADIVDVPSLGRAVGVMHEMGRDLAGTLDGIGHRFAPDVQSSGQQVVRSVNRGHGGFKVVVRHAKRTWSRREQAALDDLWKQLESAFAKPDFVTGVILNEVKGGFRVDLGGIIAFLPRSQTDVRPIRDVAPLMNNAQPFQILKMDRRRGNIVVSRRTVVEETRAEQRQELVQNLEEGQVIDGVVKNIVDYGAFVDIGGIDGLLHVTDIAWRRVNHPTEVLSRGQTVKVKIIKINRETHRVSLGIKQLLDDSWQDIEAKYPLGAHFSGRVTSITDYGAFVELEPGIEGLIHISEMSWIKENMHPGKIVSTSQEVEVQVLEVDSVKRRISFSLKRTMPNPWEVFAENNPIGSVIEGEVKSTSEFGLLLGLGGDVDGFVQITDLDWQIPGEQAIESYKKGDMVKAVVLDVNVEMGRIWLGTKQLEGDPFTERSDVKKGAVVTCEVLDVKESGMTVKIAGTDFLTFIKRSELARDRNDQRAERFAVGEKVDARVTQFDTKARKIQVSIKALEIAEEREAIAQYGSSESGATLGDILARALKNRLKDNG